MSTATFCGAPRGTLDSRKLDGDSERGRSLREGADFRLELIDCGETTDARDLSFGSIMRCLATSETRLGAREGDVWRFFAFPVCGEATGSGCRFDPSDARRLTGDSDFIVEKKIFSCQEGKTSQSSGDACVEEVNDSSN